MASGAKSENQDYFHTIKVHSQNVRDKYSNWVSHNHPKSCREPNLVNISSTIERVLAMRK